MVMAIPLELSLACPTIHRVKDPSDPCSLDVSASNQSSAHPYIPYKLHGTQNPPKHVENKVQYQQRLAQGSDHSAKSCTLINKTCSGSHGKGEPVGIQGAPLSLFLAHQCGPASAIGNARKRGSTVLERGADCSSFSESFDHDRTGDDGSSRGSEEEAQGRRLVVRKKLRLSKEESALLEEKFEEHSTLTPKQKNALAKQLNLQPRQVEVWFQNRRARTKLKQTEVDCELLRKCCASLTEENRRLQMEVDQLRALSTAQLHSLIRGGQHGPFPDAPLTICPQCQRISAGSAATSSSITTSNSCLHQAPARPNSLSSQPQPSSSQN